MQRITENGATNKSKQNTDAGSKFFTHISAHFKAQKRGKNKYYIKLE